MISMADSSSLPKGKHNSLNSHSFPLDTKAPKDAESHLILNCGSPACVMVPPCEPEQIKPIYKRILRHSYGTDCEQPIAAVPLRSIPMRDEKNDYGKSIGEEENNAYDSYEHFGRRKEEWDADARKLEELLGQAEEYISFHNEKHRSDTNLGESCPAKKRKLGDECSKMLEGMKTSQVEGELDNNDDVISLSPQEWKTSTSCFMHKTNDVKASVGKKEVKLGYTSTSRLGCSSDVMVLD